MGVGDEVVEAAAREEPEDGDQRSQRRVQGGQAAQAFIAVEGRSSIAAARAAEQNLQWVEALLFFTKSRFVTWFSMVLATRCHNDFLP